MKTPPNIQAEDLERLLSTAVAGSVKVIESADLGASSRATPWRIDVVRGGRNESYLLRYGESVDKTEAVALQAMADHPIPTPRLLLWAESDARIGVPVFVSEFVDGLPLLPPMRAREPWAIDLYIDTVCSLQAIRLEDLDPEFAAGLSSSEESARDVVDSAYTRLAEPDPLQEAAYQQLVRSQPPLPDLTFTNGDLWPENILVDDGHVVGVIDWQHAGWSDPIFEFLLPFFLVPELRDLGVEQAYFERQGYDPDLLHWYHGVEFFDSLAWVLKTGKPYEMHTAESLTLDLQRWLDSA